jgi:tetratricopeptide (TPR) repeat protein
VNHKVVRSLIAVLVSFIVLLPLLGAINPPFTQDANVSEVMQPKASAAMQQLLDEANRLTEMKLPVDALRTADQALQAAEQVNDRPGVAFSEQQRAKILSILQRQEDALSAWTEAAKIWGENGDSPEQITALVQAGLLCASKNNCHPEEFFAEGLSVGKAEGRNREEVSQTLQDWGVALYAQDRDKIAWDYLSVALAIREKQNPESLRLVETLNTFAKVALDRGINNTDIHDCSVARDYSARAAEITKRLSPVSPILVESLHTLASSEATLEDLGPAREHFLEGLRIQQQLAPDGSLEEASILRDLENVEEAQTNFSIAHKYLDQAMAICERLSPASKQYERLLEDSAVLEDEEGDLPGARTHLEQALEIKKKLNANLAPTFINLGVVALDQYDLASARTYFEAALNLFLKNHPNNAGVPFALGNLSQTFYAQGDLASALEYDRRALAIDEARMPLSLNTADDLSVMGDILRDQGNLRAAAEHYHKALTIREKTAPQSLRVSNSLTSLASVARSQHDRRLAIEYDHRALELGKKSCPNSWCVAGILNDLGELAYEQGDLASSEKYLRNAVTIRENSLGPTHPDLAHSLSALGLTLAARGKEPEALETTLRAEKIGADQLRISVRTLSERQALAYERVRPSGLDLALTLATDRASTPATREEVFDAVIRSRALVFDEFAARHRSASGSGDPEITQLSSQLSSARTRLATLVFRGVGDTKPEAYRTLLDQAREQKEKAERLLAERSVAFRQDQARTQFGIKEIAASLPQGTVLVAYVRYASRALNSSRETKASSGATPAYAAFVLRAGEQTPEVIQLGTASQIESLLTTWRRAISQTAEAIETGADTSKDVYRRVGVSLRQKIWDPLVPALGHANKVFVVPDSALNLVSLASLPVKHSEYLIETGPLINYLSTERDLIPVESGHGKGILVVGNPAFDQAHTVVTTSKRERPSVGSSAILLRGSRSACGTFRTLHFPPLPASQKEVEAIATVWKKSYGRSGVGVDQEPEAEVDSDLIEMTGADASPAAFKQYAPGRRVLHVATHGFFLEGSCESAGQLDGGRRKESFLPATVENPLLLSGLAFAGANRRTFGTADETDGILTSEEIAGMNLEGVDWAVLSACNTGVGEIKIGEGVFGLRRAFQVAGAKTVIMSLWPVEDEMTRQWMTTMYREHFLAGNDIGESVRAASLKILGERRAKHLSTHPFYWAPFVAVGDWH